jgi:Fe-S-cluster-containing dehydrogenase component
MTTEKENRSEIEDHRAVLEALRGAEGLSELFEVSGGHYTHELDIEVIVYGRTYASGMVGPYARLWAYEPGAVVMSKGGRACNSFFILTEGRLRASDDGGEEEWIKPGEVFGEMALLEGDKPSRTVVVTSDGTAKILEMQRPALRLLRKLPGFNKKFDSSYRDSGLSATLGTIREACEAAFAPGQLDKLEKMATFKVYGPQHVLLREGQPITHVYFINGGWVVVGRGLPEEPGVVNSLAMQFEDTDLHFLGPGNCFGLEALAAEGAAWRYTALMQSRTEMFEVPVEDLKSDPALCEALGRSFSNFSEADEEQLLAPAPDRRVVLAASREISTGVIDGTNLLVMDMDKCVRCGNCSMACHQVHGRSRLLRSGIHIERVKNYGGVTSEQILVPSVCMHCQDPECLTGCPTGAIGRFENGQIDIDPKTCIGCGDCATQCPYNAISMVPKKEQPPPGWLLRAVNFLKPTPQKLPARVNEIKNLEAVKCNLCEGTPLNPEGRTRQAYSCEENCPTGALVRVNPREYFAETKNVIGTIFRDQTSAIGRNIHRRDLPARLFHVGGAVSVVAVALAALSVLRGAGWEIDRPLAGSWLSMRWLTGFAGLGGIVAAMSYAARKQIYRRRTGALRYWMLAHVYAGVAAGLLLMLHGWTKSGGLLTSALMLSFDMVVISGVVGFVCYMTVPRLLTKIEGEPLLLDDLRERQRELRDKLAAIETQDVNARLAELITVEIPRRLLSLRYLLEQYFRRLKLTKLLADARDEFDAEADRLGLDPRGRRLLVEAVEATVTLRRVESLIYLHQLLRIWLPPHVIFTAIMLVLMAAHVVQVLYLGVG